MSPDEHEEKEKGIVVIGHGAPGYKAAILAALEMDGFQVAISEEGLTQHDPCMPIHDEPCQDLSDCYDYNNERLVTHTPPFYTRTKRDIFKNPKLKGRRR